MTTRIFVCDDHAMFREGLSKLLPGKEDLPIEIVGEASAVSEALAEVRRLSPDVVLMNVALPGVNGLEGTKMLLETVPGARVIILTAHDSPEYMLRAFKAGAVGYVPKTAGSKYLFDAIRDVSQGKRYIYPLFSDWAEGLPVGWKPEAKAPKEFGALTKREREVCLLVLQGLTNREIGKRLNVSINTVRNHRAHMLNKLKVKGKLGVFRYAMRHGLIEVDKF